MEKSIDVHDLPLEEVDILQKLAELLRQKAWSQEIQIGERTDKDFRFLKKNLGNVKGSLRRSEIYDDI